MHSNRHSKVIWSCKSRRPDLNDDTAVHEHGNDVFTFSM